MKYRKTIHPDLEIRKYLEVPSIDCLVRKRRLYYFSRIACSNCVQLHALLQQVVNGRRLPWVELICDDLRVLQQCVHPKLAELPDPAVDDMGGLNEWWALARSYPREFKSIIELYFTFAVDGITLKMKRKAEAITMHSAENNVMQAVDEDPQAHQPEAPFACTR